MIKITPYITNKITNPADEILFEYPGNTALDPINVDLWTMILKYYQSSLFFAIGKSVKTYSGYRMVKKEDLQMKDFLKLFITFYETFGGIYLLDDINGKSYDLIYISVSNDNRTISPLKINSYAIYPPNDDMNRESFSRLYYWHKSKNKEIVNIQSISINNILYDNKNSDALALFMKIL